MSQSAEDKALHQLQQEQSQLLDKIDELRTIGLGGLVELPQLIVCGNQSSGKSSVLEAISRVRFPAKKNVCTRFATEVILRRSQRPKIKISIQPGTSHISDSEKQKHLRSFTHEEFSDGNDLPALIEKAKEHMGISESVNSGFSDDILKVEISGPDKPELTLVDLPGLYYSTSEQQGEAGIGIVRGLTERYMANSRSIILTVISAKTDYHLQEVLNIAETFDEKRERTLGIITQPDILEHDSEEESTYIEFLQNRKVRLQLGWHALRNRSFETRDASDDDRDAQEKQFFEQGRWSTITRGSVGVNSLRRRLSGILLNHIQRNLPDLIADIQSKISDREQALSKLGGPRVTLQQQRGFLLGISSAFERICGQALNGMYADQFFSEAGQEKSNRLLRAEIRQLNEFFAEAMTLQGERRKIVASVPGITGAPREGDPENPYLGVGTTKYVTRRDLEAESSKLARQNRGIELPGSANQLLVGNLFRDQAAPWEGMAKKHLVRAWDAVRYFVYLLLGHLTDEHTTSLLASRVLEPELEKMKQALLEKLDELTSHIKRGHPLPVGKSFLTRIQKARSARLMESLWRAQMGMQYSAMGKFAMDDLEKAIRQLEDSSDLFAAADIVDQMQAYYDVAILTFIDNVATLGIENCLLGPLQHIFTSQVVNDMEDAQIKQLAAEPTYVSEERDRLIKEREKLREGLRTFDMFRPMASFLQRPNATDEDPPAVSSSKQQPKPSPQPTVHPACNNPGSSKSNASTTQPAPEGGGKSLPVTSQPPKTAPIAGHQSPPSTIKSSLSFGVPTSLGGSLVSSPSPQPSRGLFGQPAIATSSAKPSGYTFENAPKASGSSLFTSGGGFGAPTQSSGSVSSGFPSSKSPSLFSVAANNPNGQASGFGGNS
ncbi:P-loop containing nucleoside triphosphate hydrolase protein [Aspergillus filifer]